MTILETNGLTKKYGSLTAVDQVSLSVEKGQVFGFLGPNGSGKTTTIGMLLGIITPSGGTFRMFGRDGSDELHSARRRIGATLGTRPRSDEKSRAPASGLSLSESFCDTRRDRVLSHEHAVDGEVQLVRPHRDRGIGIDQTHVDPRAVT